MDGCSLAVCVCIRTNVYMCVYTYKRMRTNVYGCSLAVCVCVYTYMETYMAHGNVYGCGLRAEKLGLRGLRGLGRV